MPAELINPYIAGAPVTEVRMFFGREDVFDWIQTSLTGKYSDHILVIHGQRRVGKTSVLKQLGNRLPEKYIPVFFDLQGRTHTTLDRFLWWLARETVRVLKLERDIDVPIPQREDFARDPEFFETVFLPSLRPFLGEKMLLFTFDEFDSLEESDVKEDLARPLIDHLRRLMGRNEMCFIYSIGSSGRKLENMQASYTEFFKTALYKKISFLSEEQTRNLIVRPVEGLLEFDQSAVRHIFELASGHPYFTQLTCHELFARCQRTGQQMVKDGDVEAILDDVVERGTVNLKFTWDEASDIEKWCLAALSELGKTDNHALAEFLHSQRVRFSDSDLTSGLLHLREKDILTSQNHFVIYLLKIWLRKNRPMEQVREELTEVNPIANRYIEIGLEFMASGLYDKALESFQEALSIAPESIPAQVNIAMLHMNQKAFDKAVASFEKVLDIDDEDVVARGGLCDAHLALGDAALSKGRPKEAILSYQRVLSINQEHLEARHRMADISRQQAEKALENGKDEDALSAFSEALKFTPEDSLLIQRVEEVRAQKKAKVIATLIARAEKEEKIRNWDKAIAALKDVLELSPEDGSILEGIKSIKARQKQERLDAILSEADLAEKASRWDTAIAALDHYLELKPEDLAIQKRLAGLVETRHAVWLTAILTRSAQAVSNGKWDDAIYALNEVLSVEPDNIAIQAQVTEVRKMQQKARLEALLRQAELDMQTGKWEDAIFALNKGLAAEPANEQIRLKLDDVRQARRTARLEATLRLADTSARAGKWEIAIQALTELLDIEPENAQVQQKIFELQAQQRECQLKMLYSQARALVKAEKFEEAISVWQQYLALEPADPEKAQAEIKMVQTAQILARTYADAQQEYAKGNYEKAIGLLKEVIDQDVNYKNASLLLAQAIEFHHTAPKWWKRKWFSGAVLILAAALIGWFVFQPVSPLMVFLTQPGAATVPVVTAQTSGSGKETIEVLIPEDVIINQPTQTPVVRLPYQWVRLNSGQFLPRDQITAIAGDPDDPGVIYIGTQHSGVYKSIDGGLSWQPSHAGLDRAFITGLIVDPDNPSTIYASVEIGGIFKSTDGAKSWYSINSGIELPGGQDDSRVVMDSQNSQHLYFTQRDKLYQTMDGGVSWQVVGIPDCMMEISNLAIHPGDGNTIFLTELIGGKEKQKCESGVYTSKDAGKHWSLLPMDTALQTINFVYGSLKIDPRNADNFYISTQDRELYGSFDGGQTWQILMKESCNEMVFDQNTEKVIYCGAFQNVWVSQNNGQSWSVTLARQNPGDIKGLTFLNSQVIMAGGRGLYVSDDNGKSWVAQNSGLGNGNLHLLFSETYGSELFIEDNDQRIYVSNDSGNQWENWGGERLTLINSQTEYGQPFMNQAGQILYSNINRVDEAHYTKDGGLTWNLCSQDDNTDVWASRTLSGIAIDPRNDERLFLATRGGGILVSSDSCQSWKTVNAGLGSLFVNSLAIDSNHPDTIYAGTDGGAYVSLDNANTWNEINDGLLGATVVYSIVVDRDSHVYASTPYGIFSLDNK